MDAVELYIYNANNINVDEFIHHPLLRQEDIDVINRYKTDTGKKEKLISFYLKRKYIGDSHISNNGKPLSNDSNIFFNISHSHGYVALVISHHHDVGVDIELIKHNEDQYIKYICSDDEYHYIKEDIDFIKIWTNKESLLKCIGSGLTNKLKEIPSLPLEGNRVYLNNNYYVHQLVIDNCVISITLDNSDFDVKLMDVI